MASSIHPHDSAKNLHQDPSWFESSLLPKLPVPELKETLVRYLEAVRVVVDDDAQYAHTEQLVREFIGDGNPEIGKNQDASEGILLQRLIEQRRQVEDNWAYRWWLDDMYLNNDIALPVNSNPGMVFPIQPLAANRQTFLCPVVAFISAILDYKDRIDRQQLVQDRAPSREKGQPLCMAQYDRLFSSCRVPGIDQDKQRVVALRSDDNQEGHHLVVAHQGQFWRLDVYHKGKRMSPELMISNLSAIVNAGVSGKETDTRDTIGILTAENRRQWGQWRCHLLKDATNMSSLQCIESACMIICLDEPIEADLFNNPYVELDQPTEHQDRDDTSRALQMIHGGGSRCNSANRWFDKTMQFIFSPDGSNGICYEHSSAEGIVLVQMIETALKTMDKYNIKEDLSEKADGDDEFPKPQRLQWNVDNVLREQISLAKFHMDKLVQDLDFKVYRFNDYGKEVIKRFKVSPDVYIQLILQLTYFNLHGKLVATYESASTRRFRLGRVDCIRSATLAAQRWVRAMADPNLTTQDQLQLFYTAAEVQTKVMVDNILGCGIDIHLLGLRQMAVETKLFSGVAKRLFADPSYFAINHFALSTSQIPTTSDSFMGYGPVVPDGYGCSYNPHAHSIVFCVSSFRSNGTTNTHRFVTQLADSLDRLHRLLDCPTVDT